MLLTEFFTKLVLAKQLSVKNAYIKFHENPMNVLVADSTSQPDGRVWSHKMFVLLHKEHLKCYLHTSTY